MTFSEIQRDAEMRDRAIKLAMHERRWMGFLADSWSGGHKRRVYNVPNFDTRLADLWRPPSADADLDYR